MKDDVYAPDGVNLHGDVAMNRDGDDKEEEHEDEEEAKNQDEDEVVVVVDQDEEEEDKDEDDGKEPQTIGQGVMVNPLADDVDTMVDDHPILLPEQGQKICEHTGWPQPPASTPPPQTPERRPRPQTPETHRLSGREHLGIVTPQKPRPAVPTLQEAEDAGNTSDVDVDQQLLIESAGGDSLPSVSLPDVFLPNFPLRDVPLLETRLNGSIGED
jgi:hypothetical protein